MPQTPTLEQVLAAGNSVPADGTIVGPNGSSVTFAADGSLYLASGAGSQVWVKADGSASMRGANGGAVTVYDDGSVEATSGTANLDLRSDGSAGVTVQGGVSLNLYPSGAVEFSLGSGGLFADLPTSDPHQQGHLYSESGTVKVSAG